MQRIAKVLAAAAVLATPVQAQLNSLPVFVSPKGGTGLTLAFDYGRGVNNESGKNTAIGARASLGFGPVAFGVGAGTVDPVAGLQRETELQYMGNASLRVIGSALVPVAVSLYAGAGVLNQNVGNTSTQQINIPLAVGIALNIPTPGFTFEPWVAPRYGFSRVDVNGITDTQMGPGVSAGVGLGFAMGLGLHAAVDWSYLEAATLVNLPVTKPAVFGIGLNYTFRLPGLGVPVVPGV